MVKQTNKEWLEQEIGKLDFNNKFCFHSEVILMVKHGNGADVWINKDNTISVIGTLPVFILKKLIKIAEEYKRKVAEDE